MARDTPMVVSDLAARGVEPEPREHLVSAATPEACAGQVVGAGGSGCARALRRDGTARVESHHTWATAMHRLDTNIDDCLARASRFGTVQREAARMASKAKMI